MQKIKIAALILFTATMVVNCSAPPENKVINNATPDSSSESVDVAAVVATIDGKRAQIELGADTPVVIETTDLRPKVKQKWKTLHFYLKGDQVVRIKTYPYPEISARTEEFYLDAGQPILAVIEDNGTGERGKSEEEIDKMYYFHKGEVIKEVQSKEEGEYAIKASDGEELLAEVAEYLDIFAEKGNAATPEPY
ncbi:MAG: hypothetical protein AAGA85_22475 [Bacteroidota bacterium]